MWNIRQADKTQLLTPLSHRDEDNSSQMAICMPQLSLFEIQREQQQSPKI